ncbi:MAG: dTDP-4-dehydrorhamnose reductase [Nitrospiraceae bacterium]|nr:dTDP-4-dehydrorhamnose reductase [Nitrospiraceae bacterium]
MRVCVIGSNGQLGSDVSSAYRRAGFETSGVTHDMMDVSAPESCREVLGEIKPDLVINTAAAHNVELCEKDPMRAFAVNGAGARNLAVLSNDLGFVLVHVSTDYVFDGLKAAPYVEEDCPSPLNVYGNTKLSGEIFVRTIAKRHFVARVSALYGKSPCRAKNGLNFVQLMLKLAREREEVRVVDDEFVSPTHTPDVANQLVKLTETQSYGLYHCTSRGGCSWYEFARAVFELKGVGTRLARALPGEFPAKVPRPKYSVLENAALEKIGLDSMPHWKAALTEYLAASP